MSNGSFAAETKETLSGIPVKAGCCRKALDAGRRFTEVSVKLPETSLFHCDGCRAAFLRGVFLACGTVVSPERRYHLEFAVPKKAHADFLATVLSSVGLSPKTVFRPARSGYGLYFKDSEQIGDLLTLIGAQNATFRLYDAKIYRDLRNDANRHTNCDTANIDKTIRASTGQMDAIVRILDSGLADKLPPELRETLDLRAAHPDANLQQLADLHTPPLTKSGVYHRLQRILTFDPAVGSQN